MLAFHCPYIEDTTPLGVFASVGVLPYGMIATIRRMSVGAVQGWDRIPIRVFRTYVPLQWHTAQILALHKLGNWHYASKIYHLMRLLLAIRKIIEIMVNRGLVWDLESRSLLSHL